MPKIPLPEPKHDHTTLKFPEGFIWGAATSAHQVEGNNTKNDWWEWEQKSQPEEKRSGIADDQYNLYEKDFDLIKELGHTAHRLSLEWSRIEPEPGVFDEAEIEHYRKVLQALKDRKITVMLTIWHFTIPEWLAKKGGWESFSAPKYFERFVKRVVPEYKDLVDLWITLNEPGVYGWQGYLLGLWPPQKKNLLAAGKVSWNLIRAHKRAYKAIHKIIPKAQVGIAQGMPSFNAFHKHSIREMAAVWGSDIFSNHLFYKLSGIKTHDFLGVNYYFNNYFSLNGNSRFPSMIDIASTHKATSDLGWEIYPQGMFEVLVDISDYHKPIYITENGLASANDDRRARFLVSYLQEIFHAIASGANVRGYFHWSLLDNFEWSDGFEPRFGLVEVDYENQKRTPRPSSKIYKEIIQENGIPHYLLRLVGHTVDVTDVLNRKHHND